MQISKRQARRIAINAQLLDKRTKLPKGKKGVAQAIEHLGYIQIDTISVIERAHHHTIWNRCPDYTHAMLDELQSKDRRVFEYWGHAASYLPMSDYRFYRPLMKKFLNPFDKWMKVRMEKSGHLMKPILRRIKKEGPLSSKDFEPGDTKSGNWWDWKPAKIALEMLFWQGKLMITERRKFQRVYDLTERVLPDNIVTKMPTKSEIGTFLVRRALMAHGIVSELEIRHHIRSGDKEIIGKTIKAMLKSGEIIAAQIENLDRDYYMTADRSDAFLSLRKNKPGLSVLSPFDNLVIQRERTSDLFGFDYTIECYVPAPKRVYGYFVLPVLYGEELVGRIDCKADRKGNKLLVNNLVFEDRFKPDDRFVELFKKKLNQFALFNGAKKIRILKCENKTMKTVFP